MSNLGLNVRFDHMSDENLDGSFEADFAAQIAQLKFVAGLMGKMNLGIRHIFRFLAKNLQIQKFLGIRWFLKMIFTEFEGLKG